MKVIKLLNAQTTTNVSGAYSLGDKAIGDFTVQITTTGTPTTLVVDALGSIDGVNYVNIGSITASVPDDMFHIAGKPCKFIKVQPSTITGGTSPTVTIHIGFEDE